MRISPPYSGNHWEPGNHWIICDECGLKYRKNETRKRWDKAIVCSDCWEPRHPQDFVRGKTDRQAVKNARPEGTDTFITTPITQDDL
jgi:hypothetical protein